MVFEEIWKFYYSGNVGGVQPAELTEPLEINFGLVVLSGNAPGPFGPLPAIFRQAGANSSRGYFLLYFLPSPAYAESSGN